MLDRKELFPLLVGLRSDEVVIHTMSTKSDWPAHSEHLLDFFVQGAMGYASSVGLGVAVGQPDRRVWVIDGDGSLLMNLGTLATIARARPKNLVHILLENGVYELTGRIPTPGAGVADFCALARAAGYTEVHAIDTIEEAQELLPGLVATEGPVFVSVRVNERPREPMASSALIKKGPEAAEKIHAYFAGAAG
jgi:sulfopyruvate decarboxylase subunit beta